MEERMWLLKADSEAHIYYNWEDILEDFSLFAKDYTTVEVFDPILGVTLLESEEGEITDKLGLLE